MPAPPEQPGRDTAIIPGFNEPESTRPSKFRSDFHRPAWVSEVLYYLNHTDEVINLTRVKRLERSRISRKTQFRSRIFRHALVGIEVFRDPAESPVAVTDKTCRSPNVENR